jgi:hypothetical protein
LFAALPTVIRSIVAANVVLVSSERKFDDANCGDGDAPHTNTTEGPIDAAFLIGTKSALLCTLKLKRITTNYEPVEE